MSYVTLLPVTVAQQSEVTITLGTSYYTRTAAYTSYTAVVDKCEKYSRSASAVNKNNNKEK